MDKTDVPTLLIQLKKKLITSNHSSNKTQLTFERIII